MDVSVPATAHSIDKDRVLEELGSSSHGLSAAEARRRLERYGPNTLPHGEPPPAWLIFLRQFLNPLIYVLLAAAAVSLLLKEFSDAGFILVVLLINAVIGTIQEYNAEKSAEALRGFLTLRALVVRGGEEYEIDAENLVPGDVVLLESGAKVPADLRLCTTTNTEIDESLLTGESVPVTKSAEAVLAEATGLADRKNMAFAGTLVGRGRALGVVTATGLGTEIGRIASSVLSEDLAKPPLLVRMERFTKRIAIAVGIVITLMAGVSLAGGAPLEDIFVISVALAVAAIPEGLPVALTVALAIGLKRMSRRNVIVRKLVAVESLGSCTFIASDKTGTLTMNELTVRRIALPETSPFEVTGEGVRPEGEVRIPDDVPSETTRALVEQLGFAGALCNEGFLGKRDGEWAAHGDAVDVALLVLAHKLGITRSGAEESAPEVAVIPFESDRQFAATLHDNAGEHAAFVKGAYERILPMCSRAAGLTGDRPVNADAVRAQATALAEQGYKIIALASGPVDVAEPRDFSPERLQNLRFLGLVGMIDPLRPEAAAAVRDCREAGINVAMVTGDHPVTAFAIARELGLAEAPEQVVTGTDLRAAAERGAEAYPALVAGGRVFARVEPRQKLEIVQALRGAGHFVAVTGDGANDAPAMRAAHVSVAMGKRGTDVARETAELIVTDDNFASIVAGVEEGRVAYANVRKVIFLLISTGAAEIVLFLLSTTAGLPPPLFAAQLLWLNLVTNGIQDVALAFEPAEGDELQRPPRPPREPIFNQLMIERCLLSALVVGGAAFAYFEWSLRHGTPLDEARNSLLLLMVLFENIQVGNARSELRSALVHSPFRNRLLLFGTLAAQLIHIGALFTPGFRNILGVAPVSASHWLELLAISLTVFAAVELHKFFRRRTASNGFAGGSV